MWRRDVLLASNQWGKECPTRGIGPRRRGCRLPLSSSCRCGGSSGSHGSRKIPDDGKSLGAFAREAQKPNQGTPIFDPKPVPGVKHVIAVASGEQKLAHDVVLLRKMELSATGDKNRSLRLYGKVRGPVYTTLRGRACFRVDFFRLQRQTQPCVSHTIRR